jgi:hypothetical protein
MANYPLEHAQDAAYQSHTGRLTGLWFLPKLAQGLNTNNNNVHFKNSLKMFELTSQHFGSYVLTYHAF